MKDLQAGKQTGGQWDDSWCQSMLGVPFLTLFVLKPVNKSDAPFLKEILALPIFSDFHRTAVQTLSSYLQPMKGQKPPQAPYDCYST